MFRSNWLGLVLSFLVGSSSLFAQELTVEKKQEKEFMERTAVRYEHDCLEKWGPVLSKRQNFYVLLPKVKKDEPAPLVVYLHSAGGSAEKELSLCGKFTNQAGPEFMGLAPNSPVGAVDGWWGANAIAANKDKYAKEMTPTELRVLATVAWVADKYNVDRNRIYLCGISMGGSGSLGVGMRNGDVFASIWTGVPAGVAHTMTRMKLPEPPAATASPEAKEAYLRAISGQGLPDAPPILNFSSHTDSWAKDQPLLLRAVHDGRHAMVFAWGPWGHTNSYAKTHRAAYEFPWLAIRKNQAYPVFTDASTDQKYPGSQPSSADADGQINAFFRWKNVTDSVEEFAMELRLANKADLSMPAPLPTQSSADVTLRRLQKFKTQPGKTYAWTFGANQAGKLQPDAAGLLTFPRLIISDTPAALTVRALKQE